MEADNTLLLSSLRPLRNSDCTQQRRWIISTEYLRVSKMTQPVILDSPTKRETDDSKVDPRSTFDYYGACYDVSLDGKIRESCRLTVNSSE